MNNIAERGGVIVDVTEFIRRGSDDGRRNIQARKHE